MRRVLVGFVSLGVVVSAGACGPKDTVDVGVKDYSTSIIFGAKKKPAPLPPPPVPVFNASFPGLIEAPASVPLPAPVVAPRKPAPPPPACPPPDLSKVPPAPPAVVAEAPKFGVYSFHTNGSSRMGGANVPLPPTQTRTVGRVAGQAESMWNVALAAAGQPTITTTYELQHPLNDSSLDGLYIRQVVSTDPSSGQVLQTFQPAGEGLRIFAMPASVGVTWSSSAADPLSRTTMKLSGLIKEKQRINVCGEVVEAWASAVTVELDGIDEKGNPVSSHIEATYVVAPQFGGLIIADTVKQQTGNYVAGSSGTNVQTLGDVTLTADSVIDSVSPK